MNIGYQTSKNRVSMGLSLSEERSFKLRRLAADNKVSVAEQVGRLVDEKWDSAKHQAEKGGAKQETSEAA